MRRPDRPALTKAILDVFSRGMSKGQLNKYEPDLAAVLDRFSL